MRKKPTPLCVALFSLFLRRGKYSIKKLIFFEAVCVFLWAANIILFQKQLKLG